MADISAISTEELLKMLQEPKQDSRFPVTVGAAGMPESLKSEAQSRSTMGQALAGVGTAVNDAAMRLKQLSGNKLTPVETADVQAGRQLRQVSTPALLGGIGGQIGMTYPIAPTTLAGNAAAGGAMGSLMEPVLDGESTGKNVLRGAAGGGLGYAALKGLGMLAQPIQQSAPVQALLKQGIVPTVGEAARSAKNFGGRLIGQIEDAATSIPGIGQIVQGARSRAGEELQRAAIGRATPKGIEPTALIGREGIEETASEVSDAYRMALDKIGTVSLDKRFLDSSPQIVQKAVALNPEQKAQIGDLVEQIISSRVNPAAGAVPADVAKVIDADLGSYVRDFSRSSQASERRMADVVREIQTQWRDLIRRNAPDEATAKSLDEANRAFANLLRVEKASIKSTKEGGEFTPTQLNQAVRELTPNKRTFAKGNSLMQDLSDPAAQVLTSRLGESGTIPRGLVAGTTLGLLGGGGAVANEQMQGPEWLTKLALGTALLGPAYSRAGSRYMLGDLIPGQQLISQALNTAAPYGGQLGRAYVNNK